MWPPLQKPESYTDDEPVTDEDLLAERVEAAVRYQFRNATNAQVYAVTRSLKKAAVAYAEWWAREHPVRQIPGLTAAGRADDSGLTGLASEAPG